MTSDHAHDQAGERAQSAEVELTLSDAAQACGVSRSTIRRAREAGKLPRARQRPSDGVWVVPVTDLLHAGFELDSVRPGERAHDHAHDQGGERAHDQAGERAQTGLVVTLPVTEFVDLRSRLAALEAQNGVLRELVASKDQTIAALGSAEAKPPSSEVIALPVEPVIVPVGRKPWFRRKNSKI